MATNSYVVDDGGTFIAATQRPDGTWRKPRKVKDGYVPQDEVPLYESKGKMIEKSIPKYPVGLSEEFVREAQQRREAELKKQRQIPGMPATTKSKKKSKAGAQETKAPPTEDLLTSSSHTGLEATRVKDAEWTTVGGKGKTPAPAKSDKPKAPKTPVKPRDKAKPAEPSPEAIDPAKRVKNLRKRLKEMEAIEAKKASGVTLEKEQLDKLSRKFDVEEEISRLLEEFNLS